MLLASAYNFAAQTPNIGLTGGIAATITLSPVPLGVNATDSNHYLYISGGTGTAEAVLITGGTAVAGAASGTITFTPTNSHSGAWIIASATAGIQEALQVVGAPGAQIVVAEGTATVHAQITPQSAYTAWVIGAGRSTTVLDVASDFPVTSTGVFNFSPSQVSATNADSGGVRDLTISFIQPDTTVLGSYTHWPPAMYASGNNHVTLANVIVEKAWDVFTSTNNTNGISIFNVGASYFHRCVTVDNCLDILSINNLEGWVFGLTTNQTTAFKAVSTNNYLLDLAQIDYGWLQGISSISGKFATFHKGSNNGVPIVFISNVDMDTNGGFEMSNGFVSISNANSSLVSGTQAFSISGGTLVINGLSILNSGSTVPFFSYNAAQVNAGAAAGLQPGLFISNMHVSETTQDHAVVYATTSTGFTGIGIVQIQHSSILKSPGQSYANPIFVEAAGTGAIYYDISHVFIAGNGGTSAPALNFASSNPHSVSHVTTSSGSGWNYTIPSTARWFNNFGFTSNGNQVPLATAIVGKTSVSSLVSGVTENFIASETGANNAIAGALTDAAGNNVSLAAGLRVLILLAHTLQAGANTFTLNSTSKNIKSSANPANNIGAGYVVGSIVDLMYDGTQWQDMRQ